MEKLEKTTDLKDLEDAFQNEESIMKEMYLDAIPKQKKMILEDIFDSKTVNEEVIKWLDENEKELVREVGLDE